MPADLTQEYEEKPDLTQEYEEKPNLLDDYDELPSGAAGLGRIAARDAGTAFYGGAAGAARLAAWASPGNPIGRYMANWYAGAAEDTKRDIAKALPADPRTEASFGGKLASGAGSLAGTLPWFAVPEVGATLAGLNIAGQTYDGAREDALAHGATEEQAHSAGMKALPGAVLQFAADRFLLGKFLKPLLGKATVGEVAKRLTLTGAGAGAGFAGQTAWNNFVANTFAGYEPNRPLTQDVLSSAGVGFLLGLGGGGISEIARHRGAIEKQVKNAADELGAKHKDTKPIPDLTQEYEEPPATGGRAEVNANFDLESITDPEGFAKRQDVQKLKNDYGLTDEELVRTTADRRAELLKMTPDEVKQIYTAQREQMATEAAAREQRNAETRKQYDAEQAVLQEAKRTAGARAAAENRARREQDATEQQAREQAWQQRQQERATASQPFHEIPAEDAAARSDYLDNTEVDDLDTAALQWGADHGLDWARDTLRERQLQDPVARRVEQEYRQQAEESQGGPTLLDALRKAKKKLPAPELARANNDSMAGELQDFYDSLNFGQRQALFDHKNYTSTDTVRELLNQNGFAFTHPGDMIYAAFEDLKGTQTTRADLVPRDARGEIAASPDRAELPRNPHPAVQLAERWTEEVPVVKSTRTEPWSAGGAGGAEKWANQNLLGHFLRNEETGFNYHLSRQGIKKMVRQWQNKPLQRERIMAIQDLPELVKEAKVIRRGDDGRDANVREIHEMYVPWEFRGQVYRVRLLGKIFRDEKPNKLHSYRLELTDIDLQKEKSAGNSPVAEAPANQDQPLTKPAADKVTLAQLFDGVNPYDERHESSAGIEPSINRATLPRRVDDATATARLDADPKSGRPLALADIREYLAKALDIPVRAGLAGRRGLAGFYAVKPEIIRLKLLNDIPTLAHEIGHYLHFVFFGDEALRSAGQAPDFRKAYDAELLPLGADTSRKGYNLAKVRQEGVAEFTRLWLTDPVAARARAPKFAEHFERTLATGQPKAWAILQTGQRAVAEWIRLPALAKVKSMIVSSSEAGQRMRTRTWEQRFSRLYTRWVNRLAPIEETLDYLRKLGLPANEVARVKGRAINYVGGWKSKAEHMLRHRATNLAGQDAGPGLGWILRGLESPGDFSAYLAAKRAMELAGRGVETGLHPDDARAVVRQLEGRYETKRQHLRAYQRTLRDLLVESGLVSGDQAKAMDALNEAYVPFRRFRPDAGEAGGGTPGFVDLQSPLRRLKGSDRQILDPLESIIQNTYATWDLALRNQFGREFVDAVNETPGGGRVADQIMPRLRPEQVGSEDIAAILQTSRVAESMAEQFGIAPDKAGEWVKAWVKENPMVKTLWRAVRQPSRKDGIFTIWRKGEPEFYQMAPNGELYAALHLAAESDAVRSPLLKLFRLAARLKRTGATLTLEFMGRNPVRDTVTAGIFSKYGHIPFWDLGRGIADVVGKRQTYWDWVKAGGLHADLSTSGTDLEARLQELVKEPTLYSETLRAARHPLETLERMSAVMENATRVSEYRRARAAGETEEGAANASKDVTLNFSRNGEHGQAVNALSAFFNAQVQDLDKFVRAHKERPAQTALKAMASISAISLLAWWLGKDDEKIQQLPAWRRTLFWNFNIGGHIWMFPKPFLLGQIYGTSIEAGLDLWHNQGGPAGRAAIKDWFGAVATNLPGNWQKVEDVPVYFPESAVPDLLLPILEDASNYDFFRQQPIVSQSLQGLPAQFQAGPRTSLFSQRVAERLGRFGVELSPARLDHMITGYFAGLGKYGLDGIDQAMVATGAAEAAPPPEKEWTELPGIRGFVNSPYQPARQVAEFYEAMQRIEQKQAVLNRMADGRIPTTNQAAWWTRNKESLAYYNANAPGLDASRLTLLRKGRDALTQYSQAIDLLNDYETMPEKRRQDVFGKNAPATLTPHEKRMKAMAIAEERNRLAKALLGQMHPDDRP